jgi:pre-mRNA-splicing factor ATP-dependent RNA helicase DHX15/PRP43
MASSQFNCTQEMLSIVAMLNVPNPFIRPNNEKKGADAAKAELDHEEGDHLTLLNVYQLYKQNESNAAKWAYENYLNIRCLKSADNVRSQLERYMVKMGLPSTSTPFDDKSYYVNIRKAMTAGFFMQVGHLEKSGHYLTIKDNQVPEFNSVGTTASVMLSQQQAKVDSI